MYIPILNVHRIHSLNDVYKMYTIITDQNWQLECVGPGANCSTAMSGKTEGLDYCTQCTSRTFSPGVNFHYFCQSCSSSKNLSRKVLCLPVAVVF